MITTTLGQLSVAHDALSRLSTHKCSIKTHYHIGKLLRIIADDVKHFYAARHALIIEFGEEQLATDAQRAAGLGETVHIVTPANVAQFTARFNELCAVEVQIDWKPLELSALGDLVTDVDLSSLIDTFLVDT